MSYTGLNALNTTYGDQGLVIIGAPCPQFFNQEPGANSEILNGVKYVRPGGGFVPAFFLTEKLDVNGPTAHPLYKWLTPLCPAAGPLIGETQWISWRPITPHDVAWNWEKFLFDAQGNPISRWGTDIDPRLMAPAIEKLLNGTR